MNAAASAPDLVALGRSAALPTAPDRKAREDK